MNNNYKEAKMYQRFKTNPISYLLILHEGKNGKGISGEIHAEQHEKLIN